jgi:probable phosphoglycerate mutase
VRPPWLAAARGGRDRSRGPFPALGTPGAAGTLDLYLARHGDTEWSRSGRHTGSTDLPLLPEGEARARQLGERLRGLTFARVYASPLQRARRTAELAGFRDPTVTPLLREYDYGDYEGLTTAQIHHQSPVWELFHDGCPRGETPAQVYERAQAFVDEALETEGAVIAFAHAHILRAVACAFLERDITLAAQLNLDTAALSALRDSDRGRLLQSWNITG